jgi:hypothetical protein
VESIYYVMSWLCHRTCRHCYEDRFRPYYGDDLARVVKQAQANSPHIINNLPERMMYLDLEDVDDRGNAREKRGRIILAGGEILLEPVRETVLYPALDQLKHKYETQGGVKVIVQTTGDILNEKIIEELLARGVWMISVSGIDSFHAGLELEDTQRQLVEKLSRMFARFGMVAFDEVGKRSGDAPFEERFYHFFGATPGSWIGALWPRGRAMQNELSTATLSDNFCNRWSGGLNFLQFEYSGSEVSIDPEGNVYPCCIKTRKEVGNVLDQELEQMLKGLIGNPVYEAISMGHPERMGISHGWSVEKFIERSRVMLPSGRVYQNLCVGCDAFHGDVLMNDAGELVNITQADRFQTVSNTKKRQESV